MIIKAYVPEVSVQTINQEETQESPFSVGKYRFNLVQKAKSNFSLLDFFQPNINQQTSSNEVHSVMMGKAEENVHVKYSNVPQWKVQQDSCFFENRLHADKSVDVFMVDQLANHPVKDNIVTYNQTKFGPRAKIAS